MFWCLLAVMSFGLLASYEDIKKKFDLHVGPSVGAGHCTHDCARVSASVALVRTRRRTPRPIPSVQLRASLTTDISIRTLGVGDGGVAVHGARGVRPTAPSFVHLGRQRLLFHHHGSSNVAGVEGTHGIRRK